MSKCAVKRGIITLRDCGSEASDTCVVCSRTMCQEHTRIQRAELLCVECFAKQEEQKKGETKPAKGEKTRQVEEGEWEDESYPYRYRHHYYSVYHYRPFYYGSYYDSYYDDYDLRSFHHGGHHHSFDDDETAGGFYDS